MNIEELESILSTYRISSPRLKGDEVENKSIPEMLTTFLSLIKEDVPPTQDEYIRIFKERNPNLKLGGLVSRLKRSYLSYIREYHLGFLLRNHFDSVVYDEKTDILGVDYIIYYKGQVFNIHAFVDTKGGRFWRSVKENRHDFKGKHIDLPMDLSKGKRVGKFILYTDVHMRKLKQKLDMTFTEISDNEVDGRH